MKKETNVLNISDTKSIFVTTAIFMVVMLLIISLHYFGLRSLYFWINPDIDFWEFVSIYLFLTFYVVLVLTLVRTGKKEKDKEK